MAELPSLRTIERYIRDAATRRGIDPNVAVRVARSEGLAPGVWQSNHKRGKVREPSFGPFQLLVGGPGTGFPRGLGNAFMRATGLDPRNKNTVFAQIEFALNAAARHGWGQWFGAAKVGVDRWTGLRGAQPAQINREAVQIASLPDDAPIPTPRQSPSLVAGLDRAPIPANLPSPARPDNMVAGGPSFARPPVQIARSAPLQAPAPERFGGRASMPSAPPVMAGFAPDPSRFGRTPMAPAVPTRGDRVGTGAFTSQTPAQERFGGSVPVPAVNPVNAIQQARMAPPDVPDPARLGQIAMGPIAAPAAPPAPQMRSPRSMETGPGALSLDFVPPELMPTPMVPAAPQQPLPMVPAPPLAAPTVVREMPVHEAEAGFPMVPQAPRVSAMDVWRGAPGTAMSNGNSVTGDAFGNVAVTNKYGATTINTPSGQQAFGSLFGGAPSSMIPGPLGNPQNPMAFGEEGKPKGFAKPAIGALAGAKAGAAFGLPGLAIGGLLGGLIGREMSKPNGGIFGDIGLGGNRQTYATGFPSAPAPSSNTSRPMSDAEHRDFLNSRGIRESKQAQNALSRGGGLY